MNLFKSLRFLDDLTTSNLTEPGALVLVDTNLVEDATHAEWNVATPYSEGDIVRVTATHRLYEAIVATTGDFPPDSLGAEWIDIGATNLWRAFDGGVQSQTFADDSTGISFTFQINSTITALALFNLSATDVRVTVTPPGSAVWDDMAPTDDDDYEPPIDIVVRELNLLDTSGITDWFEYFFADITAQSQAFVTGLPGFAGGELLIEITGGAVSAVGEIAAGRLQNIGLTAWGGRLEALDFSRVDEDVFGNISIIRRNSAKRVEFPVAWPSADTARVDRILDSIRTTPAVFAATDCIDPYGFFVYGFYQTYDINVAGPSLSYATIEVRTLT
jgi:hypothetical protein